MIRQKILAFLIAILPIAYIYAFPVLINNLGHAILLFFIFPMLLMDYVNKLSETKREKHYRTYVWFCSYFVVISLIAPLINSFEGDRQELLSVAEFSVIVYFLISDRNIGQPFVNIYTRVALFFAVFLFIQYIAFILGGKVVNGVIPFLKEYNREIDSVIDGRILRISSMFAESSHFAVYEIPALIFLIFGKVKIHQRILWLVIISLAILLSTSSNGIIVMGVVYFAYLYKHFFTRRNVINFLVGAVLLVGITNVIRQSEYLDNVTYGLFTQEADMTTSKAELRIYRGFNMFYDMPLDKKVFGIGWRNASRYCKACNPMLYGKYDTVVFDYFNSIAGTLIYAGIIGLTLLLLFFKSLWGRTTDFGTRTLIICVLIIMSTSSVLMSDQWIYFLATIVAMINISQQSEHIV